MFSTRSPMQKVALLVGVLFLGITPPGVTWGALRFIPQGGVPEIAPLVSSSFWMGYTYHTATDLDTDAVKIEDHAAQWAMGWQGQIASVDIAAQGFWGRQDGRWTYREGDDVGTLRQDQVSRGGHVEVRDYWGRLSLGMTHVLSGDQDLWMPSYTALLRPISWWAWGCFSEEEVFYGVVQGGSVGGEMTAYAMYPHTRTDGVLSELALYGVTVNYRMGGVSLKNRPSSGDGYLSLTGEGPYQKLSVETAGDPSFQLEWGRSEVSGQGMLYSEDRQAQARFRWGSGVLNRLYFGVVLAGQTRWQFGFEDLGMQVKNLFLQTVNEWGRSYEDVVGRKHFSNEQTDYRMQQLSAGWASQMGFSGTVILGRMAFLGNYREYETPLFFTYYLGTHAADIEELDYLMVRLKQSWEVLPSMHFFVEGRQFIPLRIVRAVSKSANAEEADGGDGTSQETAAAVTRWSGFALGTGMCWSL